MYRFIFKSTEWSTCWTEIYHVGHQGLNVHIQLFSINHQPPLFYIVCIICCVLYIQDVINSIGGLPVMFPLLEQVGTCSHDEEPVDLLSSISPSSQDSPDSLDWQILPTPSALGNNNNDRYLLCFNLSQTCI